MMSSSNAEEFQVLLKAAIEQGSGVKTNMTKKVHRTVYPAISPLRPELSQEGKTVLVTGGGTNIGLAATKAFVQAGATTAIIVGRRLGVLEAAKQEILAEAEAGGKKVRVIAQSVDVTDKGAIQAFWAGLKQDGVEVDVLMLNAAKFGGFAPLLEVGTDEIWGMMEANLYGPLLMTELFAKQGRAGQRKAIVNVSTVAAHTFYKEENPLTSVIPDYSLSKASGQLAMQLIARDTDPGDLTIISFHPGVLYASNWEGLGISSSALACDDVSLPAAAAVWLASPEALFLHGRFVWASWDVDELKSGELRQRIDEDVMFLRVGVHGVKNGNRAW